MEKFRLENDGARDVAFAGVKLSEESDHSYQGPRQNRWLEVRIYRTATGRYVVEQVGRTCWQGESDRHAVTICADAAAVLAALGGNDDRDDDYHDRGISAVARDALAAAGEKDPALAAVAVEEVA